MKAHRDSLEEAALLPGPCSPYYLLPRRRQRTRSFLRHARLPSFLIILFLVPALLYFIALSITRAVFFPQYSQLPEHYHALEAAVASSRSPGRANPNNEKVFIAANIENAGLVDGAWGNAVKELVKILGPENVFVSIYENDGSEEIRTALRSLEADLSCNRSIVTGAHLDIATLRSTFHHTDDTSESVVRRITYLAAVRNLALRPLYPLSNNTDPGFRVAPSSFAKDISRILFLNDVYFSPTEAAHLLFSTNAQPAPPHTFYPLSSASSPSLILAASNYPRASYAAACAADFTSGISYYDSFATRDSSGRALGYGPGFRVFPWFAPGESRRQVLSGSDAVEVKSCWGGMVAFDASYFLPHSNGDDKSQEIVSKRLPRRHQHKMIHDVADRHVPKPIQFRAETEPFWDSSEACLIHADISARRHELELQGTGIYLNPYVRTAYSPRTLAWLGFWKRVENGFSALQWLLTKLSGLPGENERQDEAGGGFCGGWGMSVMGDVECEGARKERYFTVCPAPK